MHTVVVGEGAMLMTVGYRAAGELCSPPIKAKTAQNYHARSKKAGYPPHLWPKPFSITEEGRPSWLPDQIRDWDRSRLGPGNHTTGAERAASRRKREPADAH